MISYFRNRKATQKLKRDAAAFVAAQRQKQLEEKNAYWRILWQHKADAAGDDQCGCVVYDVFPSSGFCQECGTFGNWGSSRQRWTKYEDYYGSLQFGFWSKQDYAIGPVEDHPYGRE